MRMGPESGESDTCCIITIMAEAGDEALFDAWAAGDPSAGEALLDRHFEALYRFFHNKAGHDIDDLVQQTFADCLAAHGRFEGSASFRAFLFGVARNKLLQSIYARARDSGRRTEAVPVDDVGSGFVDCVEFKQERRALLRALRRIPVESQILLELVYWGGLSGREVADVCQIPHGTAKSRIRKAQVILRQQIQEVLDQSQFDSTVDDVERWLADLQGHADHPSATHRSR